jgi:hypothetical protein
MISGIVHMYMSILSIYLNVKSGKEGIANRRGGGR